MPHRSLARFALALAPPFAAALLAAPASAQPAAGAQPSSQPAVVTLQLSEYKFAPNEIDLDHGQAYVLRFTNTGQRAHGFSAKDFFRAATVAQASAPWVRAGRVEIPPGQSVDIALTAPTAAGSYDFDCPHVMHEMLGMKGQIVVR